MLLVGITVALVVVAVIAYVIGTIKLAKYGFRLGTGTGLAVLLFPPYTFYFAFFKLEQEGKEFPTALWAFGIVTSVLLCVVFWQPLSLVLTGQFDEIERPTGVAETAVADYGKEAAATPEEIAEILDEETVADETTPIEAAPAVGAPTEPVPPEVVPVDGAVAPAAAEAAPAEPAAP